MLGQGPGLVVLAGALQTAQDYLALGQQLADCYTVYLLDRRGRRGSGPKGAAYCLQTECEDAKVLIDQAGASYLFGHSYGGLVALQVALQYPVTKLALYEPAVSINGSINGDWLPAFERRLTRGDDLGALVTLIQGLQLGGPLNWLPTPLFKGLAHFFVEKEGLADLHELLPTVPSEIREVIKVDSQTALYGKITAPTLLMVGNKSPSILQPTITALAAVLPSVQIERFPSLRSWRPQYDAGCAHPGPESLFRPWCANAGSGLKISLFVWNE